jgi:menaquinone-9 beta-reductase
VVCCDVLIVGGGPAGLAAAIALRQKGLDVLVADALRPPIDKACGEGLMPDARRDLAALGIQTTGRDGVAFDGIAFLSGRHQATAHFERGPGIGIRRLHLHSLLIERCRQLNVRLSWGCQVQVTANQPLRLNGDSCAYRYAIGADGQSSRVRQMIGLGQGRVVSRRFGARCHYRLKPWSGMVEVHWGDLGQAYITPVGKQEICVATVSRSPATRMEAVFASLPVLRERLEGAEVLSSVRGALTTTRKLHRVTAGNVALVGDASGSADAVTGEGIGLSFRQALVLAEAIADNNVDIYEAQHPVIQRMPHLMSRVMLRMDAWRWMREAAMKMLSGQPQLFAHLLAVHLGERAAFDMRARDIEKSTRHPFGVGLLWSPSGAGTKSEGPLRSGADPNSLEAKGNPALRPRHL